MAAGCHNCTPSRPASLQSVCHVQPCCGMRSQLLLADETGSDSNTYRDTTMSTYHGTTYHGHHLPWHHFPWHHLTHMYEHCDHMAWARSVLPGPYGVGRYSGPWRTKEARISFPLHSLHVSAGGGVEAMGDLHVI